MTLDFQAWQGDIIAGFGFVTTLIFCVEGIARILTGAIVVIRDAVRGIRGEK